MVVLDTGVLVAQMRGYPEATKKISELVDAEVPLRVSIISAFELLDGAYKMHNAQRKIAEVKLCLIH